MAAGAVTQVQSLVCQNAEFATNPYCKSKSIWKGIMTSVLPPLLLTLWQNLCMPQLVYRGAQVTPKQHFLSKCSSMTGVIWLMLWQDCLCAPACAAHYAGRN